MTSEILNPLSDFYVLSSTTLPTVHQIQAEDIPGPYRDYLESNRDIACELENLYTGRLLLQALKSQLDDHFYKRHSVLLREGDKKPVATGAIKIYLHRLPDDIQKAVLKCDRPLGGILQDFEYMHFARPQAFFKTGPDELMRTLLKTREADTLYGRRVFLVDSQEERIAEIVEILSPLE